MSNSLLPIPGTLVTWEPAEVDIPWEGSAVMDEDRHRAGTIGSVTPQCEPIEVE